MSDVSVERDIAAPPEKVWALISDMTRMGEWSPEARGGEWIRARPRPRWVPIQGYERAGQEFVEDRLWGHRVRARVPLRLRVQAGPLAVADWAYLIAPTATGCHVIERWTDDRGAIITFLGRVVSGVGERGEHNRHGMEQTLAALAAAVE